MNLVQHVAASCKIDSAASRHFHEPTAYITESLCDGRRDLVYAGRKSRKHRPQLWARMLSVARGVQGSDAVASKVKSLLIITARQL